MPPNMPSEQEIRRRVEKRIKQRNDFYIHFAVYIAANLLMWMIWALTRDSSETIGFPWPLIVMFGWGIGLVSHALTVYFNSASRVEARERTIQREIERERQRIAGDGTYEKPKRDRHVRLSEDGELIDDDVDESETDGKRKRNP